MKRRPSWATELEQVAGADVRGRHDATGTHGGAALQKMLSAAQQWADDNGARFNGAKTECCLAGYEASKRNATAARDGEAGADRVR